MTAYENPTAGLGINADWLGVGPNIKLYGNAGNNRLVGNGDGSNTIEGGAGNDVIQGGFRSDVLLGGTGVDEIYLGGDVYADTVRGDEGDGQMLIAGEIAVHSHAGGRIHVRSTAPSKLLLLSGAPLNEPIAVRMSVRILVCDQSFSIIRAASRRSPRPLCRTCRRRPTSPTPRVLRRSPLPRWAPRPVHPACRPFHRDSGSAGALLQPG